MPKKPVSVTLDETNLLWLQGRTSAIGSRSMSDTLDRIVTEARLSGRAADGARSVVGTIDIAPDDPLLEQADGAIRDVFDRALLRPGRSPVSARRRASRSPSAKAKKSRG